MCVPLPSHLLCGGGHIHTVNGTHVHVLRVSACSVNGKCNACNSSSVCVCVGSSVAFLLQQVLITAEY